MYLHIMKYDKYLTVVFYSSFYNEKNLNQKKNAEKETGKPP